MKTFFIWDVHGCYDELTELLALMRPDSSDRVIFLWDVINKWPKSKEVIALIMEKGYEAIMGNHEVAYIRQSFASLIQIRSTLSGGENAFIENLPYYIDDPEFLAVHGGIAPNIPIAEQEKVVLVNIRTWNTEGECIGADSDPAWHDLYHGDKLIMYGHWAVQGLRKKRNSIGLDTGCCFGGHLTGYCLETDEIWQVRAKYLYKPMSGSPHFAEYAG